MKFLLTVKTPERDILTEIMGPRKEDNALNRYFKAMRNRNITANTSDNVDNSNIDNNNNNNNTNKNDNIDRNISNDDSSNNVNNNNNDNSNLSNTNTNNRPNRSYKSPLDSASRSIVHPSSLCNPLSLYR